MIKLCFIDIETTGVNREIHEIHQISGMIVFRDKTGDKIKDVFDFKIRPSEKCVYDPEALRVNNLTIEDLQSPDRLSNQKAYQLFSNMCQKYVNKYNKKDKFFFVGYNAHFDKDRMSDWFVSNGDNYFFSLFWGNHIDVMVLATMSLLSQRHKLDNFQLTTVCSALNIKVPEYIQLPDNSSIQDKKAHDAIYDILLTKQLFDTVMGGNCMATKQAEIKLQETPEQSISDLGVAFMPESTSGINNQIDKIDKKQIIGKSGYPVLDWDSMFPFKKYRGQTVQEIFDVDVQYLKWCIDNTEIEFTPEVHEDIELYYDRALKDDEDKKSKQRNSERSYTTVDYFFDNPDALDMDGPF